MKTVFRILVILVVAVLLGGLFYGAVTATSSSGADQPTRLERPTNGEFPADRPDRETSGGIQLPFDSLKNLLIISVIAAVYLNAGRLFAKKKPVQTTSS
jgi:hypothetical protein